jgi:segregation and condensation protein A
MRCSRRSLEDRARRKQGKPMTQQVENEQMPAGGARDPFIEGVVRRNLEQRGGEALIVDVAGFEGPLDLLLALAREQKVDLVHISILALADQYLDFIKSLQAGQLEIAADYLVMAAWLAYLKSRLLLPESEGDDDEPTGEELAAQLAFRLQRLEAMREKAALLMTRNRLGRDVFARGEPEGVRISRSNVYSAEIYDLLKAYAIQREKGAMKVYHVAARSVTSLREARDALERLVGTISDWTSLDECIAAFVLGASSRASAIASSFNASLDMVREGELEIRQEKTYSPIYVRPRARAG